MANFTPSLLVSFGILALITKWKMAFLFQPIGHLVLAPLPQLKLS